MNLGHTLGKYFYFDSNYIAASLQLQLYFDANLVLVRKSLNICISYIYAIFILKIVSKYLPVG